MRATLFLTGLVVLWTAPIFEPMPLQSQGVEKVKLPSTELEATAETRYMLDGVDDYEVLMDRIMLPKGSAPKVRPVGYVKIEAPDSHVAFKAKDSKWEPVEVLKTVDEGVYEYLVLGSGKVFIDAISVDKTSGAIQWDDFVITIGPVQEPDPEPDPDDPDDPDDNSLRDKVARWAREVNDPMSAQGIALVYHEVSQELAKGKLNTETVWDALRESADGVLEENDSMQKWEGFREKLTEVFTESRQRGYTASETVNMIQQVRLGLQDAGDGSPFMGFDRQSRIISKMNEAIRNAQR